MHHETHTRSVIKAVSWRILGTLATSLLVFAFTRRFALSLAVGAVEFVSKIGLFWMHERIWDRVQVGKTKEEPAVLWLTGFSGSGKSTIAQLVHAELERRGYTVELLDGDSVRDIFPNTGFTRPERDAHIRRVGFLASRLEKNGVFVVASFVSPYADSRAFVRGLCRNFLEIHVATPLEECERRDTKGLYARARRGEIANFTGISDPYEEPVTPELRIDTRGMTPEQASVAVLELLRRKGRPERAGARDERAGTRQEQLA
ncbi:MAG: adenylyl-sulfate kinase [Gemmatimonadaceae bacterium]